MLSNAFSKLKPSPKKRGKVYKTEEKDVADLMPNMAITPSVRNPHTRQSPEEEEKY